MKKTMLIPLAALLAVILPSCDILPGFELKKSTNNLGPLEEDSFYARNMTNSKFYIVKAEMLHEGAKCEVWAEKGSGVTETTARNIAREYDTKIRPIIIAAFDSELDNGQDILDYANWLAGRDNRKLTILLLNIKDGYKDSENDSYVAGYFYSGNFYPAGKINNSDYYSNGRDMIYVDTFPGLQHLKQSYATLAHELQHLVNYVTRCRLGKPSMEGWVDEGLSAYAEYLYLGEHPNDKYGWLSDERNTIGTGNNFFVWGNHSDKSLAILDDYATVYLFFYWLYLQADAELQPHIFRDISHSSHRDYRAVTDVARKINPAWSNWETLLRTWLAANYYPQNPYGYTGDNELQKTIKIYPIAGNTIPLYPGEGVYSIINNFYSVANAGNIRYAGLGNTGDIYTSSPYSGNVLLTFNANSSNSARRETGSLTGVSPSPTASRMAAKDTQPSKFNGPYVIDARDILGRDR